MTPGTAMSAAFGETDEFLCPREALEAWIAWRVDRVEADLAMWRGVLDEAQRTGDDACTYQRRGGVNLTTPPEGHAWRPWALWVEERLAEVVADPTTARRDVADEFTFLDRHLVVDDLSDVDGVVGAVLEADTTSYRTWLYDHWGSPRYFASTDLGRHTGTVVRLDEHGRAESVVETTHASVVLQRSQNHVGQYDLVAVTTDEASRGPDERWPLASRLLPAYFSHPALRTVGTDLSQERMLRQTASWTRAVLAEEVDDLLGRDDDGVRDALHSWGVGLDPGPVRLRAWLTWMVWRIRRFTWS